jgi:hypothetical protein
MLNEPRKAVFVLVASGHGTMIVNRFDYCTPHRAKPTW